MSDSFKVIFLKIDLFPAFCSLLLPTYFAKYFAGKIGNNQPETYNMLVILKFIRISL